MIEGQKYVKSRKENMSWKVSRRCGLFPSRSQGFEREFGKEGYAGLGTLGNMPIKPNTSIRQSGRQLILGHLKYERPKEKLVS